MMKVAVAVALMRYFRHDTHRVTQHEVIPQDQQLGLQGGVVDERQRLVELLHRVEQALLGGADGLARGRVEGGDAVGVLEKEGQLGEVAEDGVDAVGLVRQLLRGALHDVPHVADDEDMQ